MKQVVLQGKIEYTYSSDNFPTIKLVQEDGYRIDLVSRMREARDNYSFGKVQLSYYLSEEPKTKAELVEASVFSMVGGITAEQEKREVRYSSWTSDTDYDTTLTVGGHDLLQELRNSEGEYVFIEINFDYDDSLETKKSRRR